MPTLTNPKTGQVLHTPLTMDDAVELCEKSNSDFGRDLAKKAKDAAYLGGSFSEAQRYWLYKVAHDIAHPADRPSIELNDGAYDAFRKLFDSVELKVPRLRFEHAEGIIAISYSRVKGRIYVKCGYTYCGEIVADRFVYTRACHEVVKDVVKDVAKDPQTAAIAWGKKTSRCCFCFRDLTTPESVTAGYGPICAERWSLPWGFTGGENVEMNLSPEELVAAIKKMKEMMN